MTFVIHLIAVRKLHFRWQQNITWSIPFTHCVFLCRFTFSKTRLHFTLETDKAVYLANIINWSIVSHHSTECFHDSSSLTTRGLHQIPLQSLSFHKFEVFLLTNMPAMANPPDSGLLRLLAFFHTTVPSPFQFQDQFHFPHSTVAFSYDKEPPVNAMADVRRWW